MSKAATFLLLLALFCVAYCQDDDTGPDDDSGRDDDSRRRLLASSARRLLDGDDDDGEKDSDDDSRRRLLQDDDTEGGDDDGQGGGTSSGQDDDDGAKSPQGECPAGAVASTKDDLDCMREFELPGGVMYKVHWRVMGTLLKMALEAETTGWVGIAFAEQPGSMVPSDFIIGYVDGESVSVNPYYATSRAISTSNLEGSIMLTDISGEEEDGTTTIYFTRDTAEEGNVPISLTGETAINYAVGGSDALVYHMTTRASGTVTFT